MRRGKGTAMNMKWTPAVILYSVALILFLLAAIGANVGTIGIANLGLASLAAGLIVDRWSR